jgi:hypothetical protein
MSAIESTVPQPDTPDRSAPTLWSSVREALRGSHHDFTSGSLNRSILLLAIPMVLEMVLESLFAVVDVFWVGRLGANAVATVGLTESLLALVFAIGLGLALSTTAMVARRIGEKDPEDAAIAGVQAIVLGLVISLGMGIPAGIFAPKLLHLMGASPAIVATGSGYARIALGGCGAIIMLFLNNAIFRGAGDAAIAMRLLWVSNIINLVLDPLLIFGPRIGPVSFPHLGVTGAALATFTGRSIGVLYQFYRLLKGSERIRVLWRHVRLHMEVMLRLLRVSLTGMLQFAIANASWIFLVRIVSVFGSDSVAGYTVAIRIVVIEQRRGHAGGPEPGRAPARSRRAGRLAHRLLQHAVPGGDWDILRHLCHSGGEAVRRGSGGHSHRRAGAAHVCVRQCRLRVRNGDAAGLQRSRRHVHSDPGELLRLLGAGVAAGVGAGRQPAYACRGRIPGHRDRGMLDGGGRYRAVPAGTVEEAENLI